MLTFSSVLQYLFLFILFRGYIYVAENLVLIALTLPVVHLWKKIVLQLYAEKPVLNVDSFTFLFD